MNRVRSVIRSKYRPMKKMFIVLLCGALFVLGWFLVVRLISPWTAVKTIASDCKTITDELPRKSVSVLRVGCYNIAHGRGGQLGTANWEGGSHRQKQTRLIQIAQMLRDHRLDIVVLNEVDFSSFWSGHVNQAALIAKEAGFPYRVEQRNVDIAIPFFSLRFGNVILSKYPIVETVFLDYPHPSWFEEVFYGGLKEGVIATLALPDSGRIQVAAVHLSLEGETVRRASVQQILDVQQQSSLPMIAMGDFNSTAKDCPAYHADSAGYSAIDMLQGHGGLTTLWLEPPIDQKDFTFPSEKPDRVIDWIFVSPDWKIDSKTVIPSHLSDHLPVTALLTEHE